MTRPEAISRAKKLRRLATSDNVHEAKLAADRAWDLIGRFQITEAELAEQTTTGTVITDQPHPRQASVDHGQELRQAADFINDLLDGTGFHVRVVTPDEKRADFAERIRKARENPFRKRGR